MKEITQFHSQSQVSLIVYKCFLGFKDISKSFTRNEKCSTALRQTCKEYIYFYMKSNVLLLIFEELPDINYGEIYLLSVRKKKNHSVFKIRHPSYASVLYGLVFMALLSYSKLTLQLGKLSIMVPIKKKSYRSISLCVSCVVMHTYYTENHTFLFFFLFYINSTLTLYQAKTTRTHPDKCAHVV